MSFFEVLDEGWIARRRPEEAGRIGGPSCVVIQHDTLLSTYITQSAMGINDFCPHLAKSRDGGIRWQDCGPIWPQLADDWSILVTISRGPSGELFLFGSRCRIDHTDETFWCEATQGLKENELVWSRSHDDGATWTDPAPIPMPFSAAAEAPLPMCISQSGRWICCYSPYNTFDPSVTVDRSQAVVLVSDDEGQTWQHDRLLSYRESQSGNAAVSVTELSSGRFLAAGWHLHLAEEQDFPNGFAMSNDGLHWEPTRSTGIMGQSVGLAPLPDGRVLMYYTQRKHGPVGIGMAVAHPQAETFGLEQTEIVWHAERATEHNSSGDHAEWTDFAFGMTVVTRLDTKTVLLSFWLHQPDGRGVRYVRFRIKGG